MPAAASPFHPRDVTSAGSSSISNHRFRDNRRLARLLRIRATPTRWSRFRSPMGGGAWLRGRSCAQAVRQPQRGTSCSVRRFASSISGRDGGRAAIPIILRKNPTELRARCCLSRLHIVSVCSIHRYQIPPSIRSTAAPVSAARRSWRYGLRIPGSNTSSEPTRGGTGALASSMFGQTLRRGRLRPPSAAGGTRLAPGAATSRTTTPRETGGVLPLVRSRFTSTTHVATRFFDHGAPSSTNRGNALPAPSGRSFFAALT